VAATTKILLLIIDLLFADRAAADIADGAADQSRTDHLAETPARDHANACTKGTADDSSLLPGRHVFAAAEDAHHGEHHQYFPRQVSLPGSLTSHFVDPTDRRI
jgi:hypothetical protein